MSDALFALDDFAETRAPETSFVPACSHCSARGEPIVIDGVVVRDWHAAAVWAELSIAAHMREYHREHCSPWMLAGTNEGDKA